MKSRLSILVFGVAVLLVIRCTALSTGFGEAGSFNGTSSSLKISHSTVTINTTSPFTIEAWFKLSATPSGNVFIFERHGGNDGFIGLFVGSDLKLNGTLKVDCAGGNSTTKTATTSLSAGQNYHAAFTWNGLGAIKLFVNGSASSFSTSLTTGNCTFDTITVGANSAGGNSNFFNGVIDEVRLSDSVRYSSDFTRPTDPFTTDSNTTLLVHLNSNSSTTALGPGDFFLLSPSSVTYSNVVYVGSPFP